MSKLHSKGEDFGDIVQGGFLNGHMMSAGVTAVRGGKPSGEEK